MNMVYISAIVIVSRENCIHEANYWSDKGIVQEITIKAPNVHEPMDKIRWEVSKRASTCQTCSD